jgi:hypothetical protein
MGQKMDRLPPTGRNREHRQGQAVEIEAGPKTYVGVHALCERVSSRSQGKERASSHTRLESSPVRCRKLTFPRHRPATDPLARHIQSVRSDNREYNQLEADVSAAPQSSPCSHHPPRAGLPSPSPVELPLPDLKLATHLTMISSPVCVH